MKPAAIAATPLARPATPTGTLLAVVAPLPSRPEPLWPQHFTPPPPVSAQVWKLPAAIALIPLARPETSTGTPVLVVVPFPSSPSEFQPQHLTPPPIVSAHVCQLPAVIALTPLARPETSTGTLLSVVVPLPSWPKPLKPQHLTPPPLVSAQVCARPGTWGGRLLWAVVPSPSRP